MKITLGKYTIETTSGHLSGKPFFKYSGGVNANLRAHVFYIFGYGCVLFIEQPETKGAI